MAPPSELTFDYFKPQIYSMLVKSFGEHTSDELQTQKLEEFIARLDEERLKIEAFKRELPLCMQLLNNATEASKQHLQSQRASQGTTPTTTIITPVLEEFIPLKNPNSPTISEIDHKSNWMASAQLWNQESEETKTVSQPAAVAASDQEADIKLALNGGAQQTHQKIINGGGGAFHPFTAPPKDHRMSTSSCGETFPELALAAASSIKDKGDSPETSSRRDHNYHQNCGKSGEKEQTNANQSHRKARRCWSPDLHRRFVNALQMLGGSQVATPKQIRELMKVDGLTNDEVKSHLQKFRLHTRRPSPSRHQAGVTAAPQVVVLGGIWVPPEYAAAAAAHGGGPALYGGAHAAASSTHHVSPPQNNYQAIAPRPSANQHHVPQRRVQQREQLRHVYGKPPLAQKNSSLESGSGGESGSIEDGKSESGSWKGESGGENGGERRGRGGEESNDSKELGRRR